LTGQRPFRGKGPEDLTAQILHTDPISPRWLRRDLDRNLETVVLKCLEKNPSRRYATAGGVAGDLGRLRRGEPVVARPVSWPRRAWRDLKHQPLAVTSVLGFGFVFALLAIMWWGDPESRREGIERRLTFGGSADLVGEKGPPTWSQWRLYGLDATMSSKS